DFFYPIKVGIDPETGRDLYQRKNVGKVRIRGLEIEGSWDISRTVSLFGNYTFNVSKIDEFSEQSELEGKYLEHSPRHKANLGLGFHDPGLFQAEIMARYVGERYSDTENTSEGKLDDYTVFDIKLSRRFFETCKAYIDILNLFDKDIKYSSDFEGPGREIRVGLSIKF
ncbi:MAG: TonB-dependent receptor, partial [Deltaproteobacteria bacterium]|nr:TonB-dependent receptor [Deltaproteobacteria bacterium]